MASAQSGTVCTADTPETPLDAIDADVADPGITVEGREATTSEEEQVASEGNEEESEETHWVGIELKDDEGNPVPGEAYKVKLPDGTLLSGRLDKDGKAKVEGLPEGGDCDISFPRIHGDEWSSQ